MYENFDAASLMQQAPADFLSPETMASMPSLSNPGFSFQDALNNNFLPMGQGFESYSNPNLAGNWMNMAKPIFRYGQGGVMDQPDSSGSLPGATTTLPASPESPKPVTATEATNPFGDDELGRFMAYLDRQKEREYDREDQQIEKLREMAREANKMGQWNTILAAGLKLPDKINDALARRNMYFDDMLRSQADAAREQAAGIRQTVLSNPGGNVPARNYIRI